MDKILVIHASFGQGHKQAASAISSYLGVPCHDLLDFNLLPAGKKIQSTAYLYITQKLPFLWRFLYDISEKKIVADILKVFNFIIYFPFLKYLQKTKPKIVITTHFFPPHLLDKLKKKQGFMLVSVVTDIKPHRQWASLNVDKFFVPTSQSKIWLTELGIKENKISDGYIAIRKGFFQKQDRNALYKKFALNPKKQTILFASSPDGNFKLLSQVLSSLGQKFNLLIIYGKNTKLKNCLEQLKLTNAAFFSFYQKMWELVDIASVIVAKPGGLTVFEGCYKQKPFVFTHFIPGQEEDNMIFLKKYGLAETAFKPDKLTAAIEKLAKKEEPLREKYPLKFKDIRDPLPKLFKKYA